MGLFGGKKPPSRAEYKLQEDSPYISNARRLMQTGYDGVSTNAPRVNVFNQGTLDSINSNINNVYNRAEGDFERSYRKNMGDTLAKDYGRFGTTGATPSLYARDMQNLQEQRKLADMSYNKAINYDELKDRELQRRYNTLSMFDQMYGKGEISQELDNSNYQTKKTNQDIQYANKMQAWQAEQQQKARMVQLALAVATAGAGAIAGGIGGGLASGVAGGAGAGIKGIGAIAGGLGGASKADTIYGILNTFKNPITELIAPYGNYKSIDTSGLYNMFRGDNNNYNTPKDELGSNPELMKALIQYLAKGGAR